MAIAYSLGTALKINAAGTPLVATDVVTGDQIVVSGITKYDTLTFVTTATARVSLTDATIIQYYDGSNWIDVGRISGGDGRDLTITFTETDKNTLDLDQDVVNAVINAIQFDTNTTTGTIADDRAIDISFVPVSSHTPASIFSDTLTIAGTGADDKIIYTSTLPTGFLAGTGSDTLIVESGFGAVTLDSGANAAIGTFEVIDASAANSAVTLVMDSNFTDVTLGLAADTIQISADTDMGTVTIDGGAGRDTLEITANDQALIASDLAKLTSVEILKTAAGDNSITLGATDSIDTINTEAAASGDTTTIDASARTVNSAAVGDFDLTILSGDSDNIITISQGKDKITLGDGDNTLNIATANLDENDLILAGTGTADKIVLTTGDTTIVDSQFTGVDGFEELDGVDTATSVTLGDHAFATGITKVDLTTSTGAATVDLSTMNSDADMTVLGSNNNITIVTRANDLTTGDTFTGGTGADVLELKTSGTVDATDLTNVSLIETLNITATNGDVNLTIGDANDFSLIDSTSSTGNNTIDASAELNVTGGITINTGSGNDTITTASTTNSADTVTVDAGNGDNTITLGAATNSVTAGSGDDTVNLVAGTDTLDLGAGENLVTVDYANFTTDDTITGTGTNTLKFNDIVDDATATVESMMAATGNKIDILKLAAGVAGDDQIVTLGVNSKASGIIEIDGSAITTDTSTLTVDTTAMVLAGDEFTVIGSAGTDTVKMVSDDFTSAVSLQMGGEFADEFDTLEIANVATIIDDDFTLSTGLEKLTFAIDGTHSITLGDKAIAAGVRIVDTSVTATDGTTDQLLASTIDLSSATVDADFTILTGKGDDTITMKGAHLTANDTIAAGDGINVLSLKGVSNIADADFGHVTGINKVVLDAGNNQSLVYGTNAIAAGILEIDGSLMGTGNTINVAAADVMPLKITTGAGDDTVIMSDGSTTHDAAFNINLGIGNNLVQTKSAYLTSGDIIVGGAGVDTLEITNAATLVDLSFGGISAFDKLKLADGINTVELGVKAKTAGLTTIDGSTSTGVLTATVADTGFNITGGSAADIVKIDSANLSSLTFNGAGGTDVIELTSAAALTDASFAHLSNIETLKLNDFVTAQTITLGNSSVIAANANNSGLSTIDASGLLGSNKVTIDLSGVIKDMTVTTAGGDDTITMSRGNDHITTGGGDDVIKVTGELFQAGDVIDGGADSVLGDTLEITNTTTNITDGLFAHKTDLEILKLSSTTGTYNITLGTATVDAGITQISVDAGVKAIIDISGADGVIKVVGAGASDVVLTTGSLVDDVTLGGGADTVKIASANLTSADKYVFGAGTDTLEITNAATIVDADFTNITGLETLKVGDFANSVIIGDIGSVAGINTINLSNVTTSTNAQTVNFSTMTHDGAFTVTGGAGIDTIKMRAEDLKTTDHLTGGGSTDIIELTTLATVNLGSDNAVGGAGGAADSGFIDANFTNVTGFETLKLIAGTTTDTQSLILGTEAFDSGNGLKTIDGNLVTGKLTLNLTSASDITITGGTAGTATTEVTMASASLTTADTITAGSGTADKLVLTTAATNIGATTFTNVTGVEILELQATTGTQSVVLGAGFTTVDAHTTDTAITIDGATTTSLDLSNVTTGSANDTLKIQNADFTSTDSFAFGGGTDTLQISDTAVIVDADFTNVTGLETIKTIANVTGQSVELSTLSLAAGVNKVDFTSVTTTTNTTTTDLSSMATPSTLTVLGGAGADTIKIKAANLTTTDTFTGGTGTDIIKLTTAATVNLGSDNAVGGAAGAADSGFIDANFTNVTGFETLELANFANQSMILGDKAFGLVSGGLTTINATALTGTNSVSIDMSTATNDHNITINTSVAGTGADTVTMKASHLTTNDTIALGAGTADKITLTANGANTTIGLTAFSHVTGVEVLELKEAGAYTQSITLGAGFTTVDAHVATDDVTIDATYNLTNVTNLDLSNVTTGTGDDTLKLENADFTSTDSFAFGTGTDTLEIRDAVDVVDADFTNVTGLEVVKGGDFTGQTIVIGDHALNAGVNEVNFSAVSSANTTSTDLSTTSVLADFTVLGGSGNDTVKMRTEMLMHKTQTVTAGSGTADELILTTAATTLGTAELAGVTGVEKLTLKSTTGIQDVTLVAGFTTVDASSATEAVTIDGATTAAVNLSNVTTGTGADTLKIQNGDFSNTDVFAFDTGTDTLEITDTAATITDEQFTHVTGLDVIKGGDYTGQSVVLSELARVAGVTKVDFSGVTGTNTTSTNISGMTSDITATILTGAGADTVTMRAAHLTSADTITDNGGADTLVFTTASTLADAAFTHVTGFETVQLANVAAQSIILGDKALVGGVRTLDADALIGTNAVSVDLSTATTDYALTILTGAGDDTVTMKAEDLTSADTLTGNGGADKIIFTTAATLNDSAFTNVTGFETLQLADGATQSLVLGDNALAGVKTIDATALATTNTLSVDMSSASADHNVTINTSVAGTGDDTVTMKAGHLTSADTIALGAGTADKITLTSNGANTTIGLTAFTGVSGVEVLELQESGAYTQNITLGAGFDTVNASVATDDVTIDGATTASLNLSTVTTGTGDDTLKIQNGDLAAGDVFAFGTGTDTLQIMDAATITNAQFANKTELDTIKLGNFAGQSVELGDLAIAAGVTKVDFSSITNTTYSTATTLNGTADSTIKIIGGLGADTVTMRAEDLTSADTLTGSDGVDTLIFTTAATLDDSAFTEVTGFETLQLADEDAQSLVLGDQAFNGGNGIKTINGATLVTGTNAVSIDMSSATTDNAISITTGVGADTVTMKATHLTSSDVLNGGAGDDTLVFTDAANLTADKFANVTNFKTLELQATAGTQSVALVSGFDTVDATVATAAVTIDASSNGTTDLTITTGTGADTIKIAASTLDEHDDIEGGDGVDTLEVIGVDNGSSSITDAKIAAITHVEVIKLTNPATPTSIVLGTNASANGINKIDASTTASVNTIDLHSMTTTVEVVGGAGADSVTAGSGDNTIKTGLGDDTVTIDAATLDSNDIIWGEGGTDTLILTGDASGLTASDFTNVKGFESIKLSDSTGISMILGSDADTNGILKVDASANTTHVAYTVSVDVSGYGDTINSSADPINDTDNFTYIGGAGIDTFKMQSTHLDKNDKLDGGAGTSDILEFTTVAINSTDASIFDNVTGFETLKLADVAGSQKVTLKNGAFTTIDASANLNTGVIEVNAANVVGNITVKTAGGNDIITAAKGNNNIQSGLGDDTIKVNITTFDANDIINGGDGTDTIEFSGSKTTITDEMFVGKTSVENIKVLVDESGQVITLAGNANTAGINKVDATTLTKGIEIDASGMTLGMTISTAAGDDIIKAGNGLDTIKAGNGNDNITVAANKLNSSDVIWGEDGTADKLILTGVATLDDSAFTGVKTMEILQVGSGDAQTITMGTNAIASGIKTIDTSNIGSGNSLALDISAFTQDTKIIGGTGNETVTIKASTLDGNDDIDLGTGTDKVIFSDVLTSAPNLLKLTGVETIQLADGDNQLLTLNDNIGTTLTIDATALVDINKVTVDGSTLGTKTTNLTVNTSTGADIITIGGSINAISAGGGDDTIKTAMENLTDTKADTINGGSGTNTLEITSGGTLSDAKLAGITNIQSVKLSPTVQADYNLTLGTNAGKNDILNIDGSTLTTGKLTIDASGLAELDSADDPQAKTINFKGGDANDTFKVDGTKLDSSDIIDGKSTSDIDTLVIDNTGNTATSLVDTAFTNLTNIEKLTYADSANHSLTVGDEFKESGIKTVDASALATTKTFTMNLDSMTTDMDLTVIGSNGADTITMKGAQLTSNDILQLGTGANVLELSGAATLTDANFAYNSIDSSISSTGIKTIRFTENYAQDLTIGANAIAGGLTTITATDVLTAGAKIDTSAVNANLTINTGGGIDTITLGGGNSTLNAGAGDDIIKVTAANLTANDVINGGFTYTDNNSNSIYDTGDVITSQGKDILDITTAGTLADTQFAHVTNIEEIKLSEDASQSLTFGTNFTNSGITSVDASALLTGHSLTLDISAMSIDKDMTILGGAGDDTVTILGSSLDENDKIVFGAGDDILKIASTSGITEIADEDFTNISDLETISFINYNNVIEFGDNMVVAGVTKIDASANTATGYTTKVDMTNMSDVLSAYELIGGAGDDTFLINANQLVDANTKINGGGNNTSRGDTLEFITSVVFDDDSTFAGVLNIETIKLAAGDGQKIVLRDGLATSLDASDLGTDSVEVDASALTSANNITIVTSNGNDTVTLGEGKDRVTLGDGDDTLTVISANLTVDDEIDFGLGDDTLILSTASELADTDFTNVTGLEKIELGNFANNLTLGDFAKASGLQEIDGSTSSSALTLDMSSMTSNIDLIVTAGSGDDLITMKGIHFQQTDTLDGGDGDDTLILSGNTQLEDIAFEKTTNIETLKLLAGTHNITLGTNAEAAGITTIDTSSVGANNLTINISDMTTNMTIDGQSGNDTITMGQGNDTISTGAGNDTIKVASEFLDSLDTIDGEGDADQLILTTEITSTDSTIFANVSNVEELILADGDGQKVTLRAGANNFTTIDASTLSSSNAITVDAALTDTDLNILTAGGDDVVIAGDTSTSKYTVSTGYGDDTIQFTSAGVITSANDKIYGGAGNDTLEFTSTTVASTITDSAFFGTHITGIETLKLGDVTGNSVALGAKATASGIRTIDSTSIATGKDATINLGAMAVNMTVNGGDGNDTVTAGTKNDTLNLGAGDDKVIIKNAQLTAADIIDGGDGDDTIEISDAATVTDTMFENVSNMEKLVLKGTAIKVVTLGENTDFSGLNEIDASSIGSVKANIDVSAITSDFTVTTAGGADTITLGTGNISVNSGAGNDTIKIAGTTFDTYDTIDGGDGTGDILLFTDAAILTDAELNKITNIETIKFSDVSGQSVEIGDNAKANGLKVFDASAISSANSITIDLSSMTTNEDMVLSGGAGKDTFIMQAAHFTAADTLVGGSEVDTLEFTTSVTSGSSFDDYFAKTTGIENIVLADFTAQTFTIGTNAQKAGVTSVDATALTGANNVNITASAITSNLSIETAGGNDIIITGNGLDNYTLGSGDDTITFKSASLKGDLVDGGEGTDTIIISDLVNIVDASLENVSKIEKIQLSNAIGESKLTLGSFAQDAGILELDASALTGNSTINISDISADDFVITTGTGIDKVTLGSGIDTLASGDGNDVITIRAEDLTSDDVINGGSDSDTLVISTASEGANAVTDEDFTNITALETVVLSNYVNQTIDLGSYAKNAGVTMLDASDANGGVTVDLSAMIVSSFTTKTGDGADDVTLGKSNDTVILGAGSDTVHVKNVDLNSLDSINFGSDQGDILDITDAATIIDDDFTGMVGLDILKVGNFGSQTMTVGTLASTASLDMIDATLETNSITIDASAFTNKLDIETGSGDDKIYLSSLNLANFTIDGGAGTDTVYITDRANITDLKVTNFTNTEKIVLSDFNNQLITLGAKASLSGLTTLDATTLTTSTSNTSIDISDFTGDLTLLGGAGDDSVTITMANTTSTDSIDLKNGNDTLIIGDQVDATVAVKEVQTIQLTGTATGAVTFLGTVVATSADTDTATQTATKIAADGAIITAWNAAHTAQEIDTITASGTTVTITYKNTEGDVAQTAAATSNGISFGASVETTKGSFASADFDSWLAANGSGLSNIENLQLSNYKTQDLTLGANAVTLGIKKLELTSTKNNSVNVNATAFAAALIIETLDANHTISTSTGIYNDTITTGYGTDTITLGGGNDTLYTGSGNDTINISSANLTSDDIIDGGTGTDTLSLSGVGTNNVDDTMFTNIKGVEKIVLNNENSQIVTIGESARLAGITTIDGSLAGSDFNLDAESYKGNLIVIGSDNADIITAGKGKDLIDTGDGNDTIEYSSIYLNRYDKIKGGDGIDTLLFTNKAIITDDKFSSMNSVEIVKLGENISGQSITLGRYAAKAGINTLDLREIDGVNYKVNTSAFSNSLEILVDRAGGTFITSTKDDTLTITAAAFNSTLTFNGGKGNDTIKISTNVLATDYLGLDISEPNGGGDDVFSKLIGVETLAITDGGTITLGPKAVLAGIRTIDLTTTGPNSSTVEASSFSNAGLNVILSKNADTITTGNNNDTITTTDANLTDADTIDLGDQLTKGVDTVYITDTASVDATILNKISNAEVLKLGNATGHDVDFTGTTNTTFIKVDGTAMKAGNTSLVNITGVTDQVEILMGYGDDTVEMTKADFDLYHSLATPQKTMNGGSGIDTILISNHADVVDTDFIFKTSVTKFEAVGLGAGGTVTIGANAAKAGITRVDVSTSTGDSTILTGGITKAVTVTLGDNDDSVETGIGADTVNIAKANLDATDKIWLGAGYDTLNILGDATGLTMAQMGGVVNVETLKLSDATTVGQTVDISSTGFYFLTFDGRAMTTGSTIVDIHGMTAKTTVLLGKGADTVKMLNADVVLTTKTINGGTGIDTLLITDPATLTDASFAPKKIAAFETINLAGSLEVGANFVRTGISNIEASGALTFTSTAVTKGYTVTGSTGNDTITLGSGADTIIGIDGDDTIKAGGGNDTFKFGGTELTSADTVEGEAGTDIIRFTSTVTTLADTSFTNVKTVEKVVFEASTAQTFNYGDLAKAAGITTIDANAVTAGFTLNSSSLNADNSLNFVGGSGNDIFITTSGFLTNSDRFTGNGGTDKLKINDAATIIDSDFTYIRGVENITLLADDTNSLTLGTQFQLSGITTIDASAVTTNTNTNAINMAGVSKALDYDITGGAGVDTITMRSAVFSSNVTIDGAGETDIITISDKAVLKDTQFALKSHIETIKVGNYAGQSIELGTLATAAGIVTVDGTSMTSSTSNMTVNMTDMSSDKTMTITGGAGNDTFIVNTDDLTAADTISGGAGLGDKLIISGSAALGDGDFTLVDTVETLAFVTGSDYTVTFDAEAKGAGFKTVDASLLGSNDVFTFTTTAGFDSALTVKGGAGDDIITTTGAATNDIISAGAGNDIITSGAGNDTIDGGLGDDKFIFTSANLAGTNKITGGTGTDTIEVTDAFTYGSQFALTSSVETLSLLAGGTIVVNAAMNKAGFKEIDASSSAGALNVDASGTTVGLTITGGDANDFILGSKGNDILTGGEGTDTFKFTTVAKGNGKDTITDYDDDNSDSVVDTLSLFFAKNSNGTVTQDTALHDRTVGTALSETDFNYYITNIDYQTGIGAEITLLGGDTITLLGVNSGIDKTDFVYA